MLFRRPLKLIGNSIAIINSHQNGMYTNKQLTMNTTSLKTCTFSTNTDSLTFVFIIILFLENGTNSFEYKYFHGKINESKH